MSGEHISKTFREKFNSMKVASIKMFLKESGVTVNGYLKPALVVIAAAVESLMLPLDPNFEKEDSARNIREHLTIHDLLIENPSP